MTRPIRVIAILGAAAALWYLFGCADPTAPNIHPAPLTEQDSTVIEVP